MDVIQRCTTQQARVASFLVELLSTTTSFIVAEDVEICVKAPFLQRLIWDKFVEDYQNKPLFRRHLRMMYTSFTKLLDRIRELLEVDDDMAALRGGTIIPEIHLYATIRYLAGGSYSDICIFCGISVPSFYCILRRTMDAINRTLVIEFPSTKQQCAHLAENSKIVATRASLKIASGPVTDIYYPLRLRENAKQRMYVLILVATTRGMALTYRPVAMLIVALHILE